MHEHTETISELDYSIHYQVWHDHSDAHADTMAQWQASLLAPLVPADRSSHCLDIGCGMGFAMLGLSRLGFSNVSGIDIDRAQVAAARRRNLAVERVIDSVAYLDSHRDSYDLILLLDVLEHVAVSEQIRLLRAIYASLRNNGRLIVQVPNASAALASRWRYIDATHTTAFTEHSLNFVLRNAGFPSVVASDLSDPAFPRIPRRFWKRSLWKHFGHEFRRWVMRFLWRQMCIAELGTGTGSNNISLNLNLVAMCEKTPPRAEV